MDHWCSYPRPSSPDDRAPAAKNAARADSVRRQLHRILASEQFRGSLRLKHFLYLVVEMMLAGNSAGIKAYTIAVDALGRGAGFDPQRDPIVRVEAARLRQALARYYAGAGRDDALVIDLPRGTYVPVVRGAASEPLSQTPPGDNSARENPVAKIWWGLLAAQWQSVLLQERLAWELGEQIRSLRHSLEESMALLRQQSRFPVADSLDERAASHPQSGASPTDGTFPGDDSSPSAVHPARLNCGHSATVGGNRVGA